MIGELAYFFENGTNFATILAFLLGFVFSIIIAFTLHEFAHARVAVWLGDGTPKAFGRLSINPARHIDTFGMIMFLLFGFGWAKPVPVNPLSFKNKRWGMFLVSISGVLTNILIAFICSGALFFFVRNCALYDVNGNLYFANSFLYFIYYFFLYSVVINTALFVFNLIPIYPLDGFNALSCLVNFNARVMQFMYKYGSIILLIFIILPIFDIVYGAVTNSILDVFFNFWRLFV